MAANRGVVIGGIIVVTLAIGWFFLSHYVMNTGVVDAINESLGVAFGLLVLVSVIGAFASRRGNQSEN